MQQRSALRSNYDASSQPARVTQTQPRGKRRGEQKIKRD
jgi:hypothetical protein